MEKERTLNYSQPLGTRLTVVIFNEDGSLLKGDVHAHFQGGDCNSEPLRGLHNGVVSYFHGNGECGVSWFKLKGLAD